MSSMPSLQNSREEFTTEDAEDTEEEGEEDEKKDSWTPVIGLLYESAGPVLPSPLNSVSSASSVVLSAILECEDVAGSLQRVGQRVHLGRGVVDVEAGAGGGWDAEAVVE